MSEQRKTPAPVGARGPEVLQPTAVGPTASSKIASGADPEKVKDFLVNLGGPWHLSRAGRGFPTRSFSDLDEAVALACAANNRGHCVYYMGNQPAGLLERRARQDDIRQCIGSWLDIDDPDPEIARELSDRLDWPPTYVAFTGGGWQAFWRYDEPISDNGTARAISAWLQSEFEDLSPDRTHSVEHLFRLPGTRNRKDGRDNRMCKVTGGSWGNTLPVADAGRVEPGLSVRPVSVEFDGVAEAALSDAWQVLPPWAVRILASDVRDPETGELYSSRSEHEWAFIGGCVRDGVPIDIIRAYMSLPAPQTATHMVSHRTHWAKIKGRYVPRRNPNAHIARQIGSFLAKESAHV